MDCPVCGEKLPLSAKACTNCQAMLAEPPVEGELRPPEEEAVAEILGVKRKPPKQAKAKPAKRAEPPKKKVEKKAEKKPEKRAKAKKPS